MKKITLFLLFVIVQTSSVFAQDTIPFFIGKNNKIYIKARINNSEELNFMYDTGADENAIKKSVLNKKTTIRIDGKEENLVSAELTR